MYGSSNLEVTDPTMFSKHLDRQVLPMKYNLIAMAMAAAAATDPPAGSTDPPAGSTDPPAGSAAKCGGSYAAASVILALTARFVLSS